MKSFIITKKKFSNKSNWFWSNCIQDQITLFCKLVPDQIVLNGIKTIFVKIHYNNDIGAIVHVSTVPSKSSSISTTMEWLGIYK